MPTIVSERKFRAKHPGRGIFLSVATNHIIPLKGGMVLLVEWHTGMSHQGPYLCAEMRVSHFGQIIRHYATHGIENKGPGVVSMHELKTPSGPYELTVGNQTVRFVCGKKLVERNHPEGAKLGKVKYPAHFLIQVLQ